MSKKKQRERVAVYIDGGNTYQRLKEIDIPERGRTFDYSTFIEKLVGNRELISKRYYVGIVRNFDNSEKSKKMARDQQKFLSGLESEKFDIKRGKLMYDTGKIREKGVDVKIATDLIVGAVDDLYDTAILISSDTDLIPAIKYVHNAKNKKIEYVGFGHRPSFGLLKDSTEGKLLSKTDLLEYQKSS